MIQLSKILLQLYFKLIIPPGTYPETCASMRN
jgi:hypothetical protein